MGAQRVNVHSWGRFLIGAALFILVALIFYVAGLSPVEQDALLIEDGLFETASALGYGLCIGLMLLLWTKKAFINRWYIAAVLCLFSLRELDFDKAYFTKGLFKSRQYFGGNVDGLEVFVSTCILFCVVGIIVFVFIKETRSFVEGVFSFTTAPVAVFCGLALATLSKSADGIGRKVADFGITLSQNMLDFAHVFEEIAEMGIPVMFMIAVSYSVSCKRFRFSGNEL